jgi:hypothetical protein
MGDRPPPSDHCDNHVVKGSCRCARTAEAPLNRVGHGRYLVRALATEPDEPPAVPRAVITVADFLQTVEANAGEVLTTVGGRAAFTTKRQGDDVRFIPVSSGAVRILKTAGLQRWADDSGRSAKALPVGPGECGFANQGIWQ